MPSFFRSRASDDATRHDHAKLEILLDREFVYLKGTGSDVEPGRLSGNVVLFLTEPTAFRAISLKLRGKAYLPVPPQQDPLSAGSNPPSTFTVCKHDWSFLEGKKHSSHTLKAGRHLFPFQIQLGGTLPSSMVTEAFGGASVNYTLRAVAQRTGFSSNMQAAAPVYLIRSLSRAALEYQQTRDIEHSWADKIMFSVAIPHTAWAAGDSLVSLLKISPLVKGVGVLSVTTSLRETTKMFNRTGHVTRTVASVTHEIIGGKAVELPDPKEKGKESERRQSASEAGPSRASVPTPDPAQGEDDVVTVLSLKIPPHLTPTHQLEPVTVTYVVHWSLIITNADGHLSELFCTLPVNILDRQLLSESRSYTLVARQLLVGGPEVGPEINDTNELPSYIAHVRDRVANMFLSEGNSMRVTNPWVHSGVDPILSDGSKPRTGTRTPIEVVSDSNDPYVPDPDHPLFLDWVNAELLISQGASRLPLSSSPSDEHPHEGSSTPHYHSHPPTPPTPAADGVPIYTHASSASRELAGLFVATMEPSSALTHPHWLTARPDPKDPRASSVDVQKRVREVTSSNPNVSSMLLHRAFTEVPDYEVALRGFLGGVPPLSSMQGLPSYDEASRSGTPDLGVRRRSCSPPTSS
ncbi:hypothetical protein FB45DRAFT_108525 [Roridomyces roridus]|uniref:Arrestin C-terminal-like domain-containing protein n=1 Tax=Roridomyces roridus TaxID=1738132 RepID=A0AAD7BK69_9AGAR|nr:hypothetical protein FB45DRAFT_108525 [Roridomyces roridus]